MTPRWVDHYRGGGLSSPMYVYRWEKMEALLDADPAVILLTHGFEGDDFDTALQMLLAQPGAEDLQAVREDRVVGLPATLRHADPGAVEGLEYLAVELAERSDAGS